MVVSSPLAISSFLKQWGTGYRNTQQVLTLSRKNNLSVTPFGACPPLPEELPEKKRKPQHIPRFLDRRTRQYRAASSTPQNTGAEPPGTDRPPFRAVPLVLTSTALFSAIRSETVTLLPS
ncbi:hypothetical protein Trydic_g1299 [Trypoxylus dichotomus]